MFPITNIHQIEITSRCNLKCAYCVHPKMPRAKMDMSRQTFAHAIRWALHFQKAGTQGALNLAGIGESTMHPEFIEYCAFARTVLGPQQQLLLASNGKTITQKIVDDLKRIGVAVFISLHQPVLAKPAVDMLTEAGLLAGVSIDPAMAGTDWGGQVKWKVTAPRISCPWVTGGWVMVASDGRLTRCSFDGTGDSVIGHVRDDVTKMETSPWKLCATCHQDVGVQLNTRKPKEAVSA